MRWTGAVLLVATVLPVVAAEEVGGALRANSLLLPATSTLEAVPRAVFAEVASPDGLNGTSPRVVVRLFEETYVRMDTPAGRPTVVLTSHRPVWTVHDVAITLEGGASGWIGIHPREATVRTQGEPVTLGRVVAPIGNGVAMPDGPDQPYYFVEPSTPLVGLEAERWSFEGDGTMKLFGPTLTLRSRENTTSFMTGEIADEFDPARRTRRWVSLELVDAQLDGSTKGSVTVGALDLVAAWEGAARAFDAHGRLEGNTRSWDVAGDVVLEGSLRAEVAPRAPGGLLVRLDGDLRAAGDEVLLDPAGGEERSWLFPLVLGAALTLAAGAALATRTRADPPPRIGAEDALRLAEDAADRGDFAEASRWAAIAHAESPTSVRVGLDHAYHVWRAGRPAEALARLEAPPLADEPSAQILRARILDGQGRGREAASALAEALRRTPTLVLDVDEDDTLSAIARRPPADEALAAARRRLE